MSVALKCGHASNASLDGSPACAICIGIDPGATIVADTVPNLAGRFARCPDCRREQPSGDLAFFEYRGAGSRWADDVCVCGYARSAHSKSEWIEQYVHGEPKARCKGQFAARGAAEYDSYYCGCRGWD